jgi:cytochrome c556
MNTLVRYIYYGVKDVKKYQYLIDKIKSIRSLNDVGNKRLKFILSEIVSNVESLMKTFKPINTSKSELLYQPRTILKNKEHLMKALGINASGSNSAPPDADKQKNKNITPKTNKKSWDTLSDTSDDETDADAVADAVADADTDADTDTVADAVADAVANTVADTDAVADAVAETDADAIAETDAEAVEGSDTKVANEVTVNG